MDEDVLLYVRESTLQAITLRRFDSGESDRRVVLLTREQGKIVVFVRGARKSSSRNSSMTEPLMLSSVQVQEGKTAKYVAQAQVINAYPGLRTDYNRISAGLALAELYAAIVPEGLPQEELFELLVISIEVLVKHSDPCLALTWAQLKLIEAEGHLPIFDRCVICSKPVTANPAWASPHAGGNLCAGHALQYTDRFQARAEALIGLARTVELDQPPTTLKHSVTAAGILNKFSHGLADCRLPANDSYLQSLTDDAGKLNLT